jgi:DNA topoisomerase-3
MTKTPGGRVLELEEVETLLRNKTIGPLQGFRSKQGWPFAAVLKITDDHKMEFDFGQEKPDDENHEAIDFSEQTSLGSCPLCQSSVYEHGMSYVCEKTPQKECTFKVARVILQQDIAPKEVEALLNQGKTGLMEDFVSNRTRRKFKAFLVMQKDGKVGFEFEAKAPRAPKAGATAKTKEPSTEKTTSTKVAKSATKSAAKRATKTKSA